MFIVCVHTVPNTVSLALPSVNSEIHPSFNISACLHICLLCLCGLALYSSYFIRPCYHAKKPDIFTVVIYSKCTN